MAHAAVYGVAYIASMTAEVSLIKSLNTDGRVVLPLLTAVLLNQAWVVLLPTWAHQSRAARERDEKHARLHGERPEECPRTRLYAMYAGLGVVAFLVTTCRSTSTSYLPGSVAAVLLGSSMPWNMVLSAMMLGRTFHPLHHAAAALGLAAVFLMGISQFLTKEEEPAVRGTAASTTTALGTASGLVGGVAIAFMSVLTAVIQKKAGSRHRTLRVTQMTVVSTLVAAVLLLPLLAATGEWRQWGTQLRASPLSRSALVALAFSLPINKAIVRGSKCACVSFSSPFLFEFVQAAGGLVTSLAQVFLFHEEWTVELIVAMTLLAAGSACYLGAQRREDARTTAPPGAAPPGAAASSPVRLEEVDVLGPLLPRHSRLEEEEGALSPPSSCEGEEEAEGEGEATVAASRPQPG